MQYGHFDLMVNLMHANSTRQSAYTLAHATLNTYLVAMHYEHLRTSHHDGHFFNASPPGLKPMVQLIWYWQDHSLTSIFKTVQYIRITVPLNFSRYSTVYMQRYFFFT